MPGKLQHFLKPQFSCHREFKQWMPKAELGAVGSTLGDINSHIKGSDLKQVWLESEVNGSCDRSGDKPCAGGFWSWQMGLIRMIK